MNASQESQVAVVTGASSGIGRAAAKALVGTGWHVIGVGRDPQRCRDAETEINGQLATSLESGGRFDMVRADMSFMSETARSARDISALTNRVDVLLNNAGGMRSERVMSSEGHEATFAANHLAAFLLTEKLLPLLRFTAAQREPGAVRVIGVSSSAHEYCPGMNWDDLNFNNGFTPAGAYLQAKLANVLFARELAKRCGPDGIASHVMHPGLVASNFASHGDAGMKAHMEASKDRAISPEQAADTLVWLATDPQPGRTNGLYFHERAAISPSAAALDDESAKRLWNVSEKLVANE